MNSAAGRYPEAIDADATNAHICRWLTEVIDVRVHVTTQDRPVARVMVEQTALKFEE